MSTEKERKEVDTRIAYIVPKACNGDKFAEKYLYNLTYIARKIDDIYDSDYEVSKEDIELLFRFLLIDVPSNPFVIKNYNVLLCQHVLIYNCWLHANRWADDPDDTKQKHAFVIKEYIVEMIPLVAFLTGGIDYMNKIALEARELFLSED